MPPADKRLDADDALGVQVDDRLVLQKQLALTLERVHEVHLQRQTIARGGLHLRAEYDALVAAAGLGAVEREIGRVQQLVGWAIERERNPDAGRE